MMKASSFMILIGLLSPLRGEEPAALPVEPALIPAQRPVEGPPWLGFRVAKPDEATRANLPDLPAGSGFVIQTIDAKGPAEASGLKPLDVVWKLGDQLLVNEAQLAVLLRLRKPGEVVPLSIFRSGRAMEVSLVLGAFPLNRPLGVGPELDITLMPGEGRRSYSVNPENRTASLTAEEGKAVLKRIADGSGYELEIRDASNALVFNGNLPADGDASAVPEAWRRRVCALRRGLDTLLDGKMETLRPPRPRIVPVPSEVR